MPKIGIDIKSGTLEKERVAGIDLGTTNSLIAFIGADKKPYVLEEEGHLLVPSVIHFGKDQLTVGQSAVPFLTEDAESTIYSIKRFLGKSYDDVDSNRFNFSVIDDGSENLVKIKARGKYYSPIQLSAMILKELKERAEAKLKQSISKAVITVPAYFNDSQRQATKDAGKLAGLEVLRIINEPTAASLAYGLLNGAEERTIVVYDLGGGTFDVSILRIEDGIYEVLSTHGDVQLGGDDFDQAIIANWLEQNTPLKEALENSNFPIDQLRVYAKQAKEALSDQAEYNSKVEVNGKSFELSIDLETFEKVINPLIQKTISSCKMAIQDAELGIEEIDEVVMVGGSTRVRSVKEAVRTFFRSSHFNDSMNPDEVVALGAAIEADILSGNRKDMVLLDVTPLSLGIEMVGGLMDVIIPRNSKIPTQLAKEYTTSVDGQVNLAITIYQGERELVKDNRKLASFELKGIPAMPAGLPKIEVTFKLNSDGILKVSAKELRSNMVQEIEVKPSYGLTDNQVEQMLKESLQNAEEDIDLRMNEEVRTEGKQLLYLTERFLEKNKEILTDEELLETKRLMHQLSQRIERNESRDAMSQAIESLNNYTQPFAERLMDNAVKDALKGKKIH